MSLRFSLPLFSSFVAGYQSAGQVRWGRTSQDYSTNFHFDITLKMTCGIILSQSDFDLYREIACHVHWWFLRAASVLDDEVCLEWWQVMHNRNSYFEVLVLVQIHKGLQCGRRLSLLHGCLPTGVFNADSSQLSSSWFSGIASICKENGSVFTRPPKNERNIIIYIFTYYVSSRKSQPKKTQNNSFVSREER